jgi:hypothetical protein
VQDKSRSRPLASNIYSFHKPASLHDEQHASSHLHSRSHHRTAKTSKTSFNQMQQLRQSLPLTEVAGKPIQMQMQSTAVNTEFALAIGTVTPLSSPTLSVIGGPVGISRLSPATTSSASKNEALERSSGSRATSYLDPKATVTGY